MQFKINAMDDVKKLLGLRIKELRRGRNISQEKLAELVNLDRRSISNIECGKTFPSTALFKIASVLETDVKNLFDFEVLNKSENEIIKDITSRLSKLNLKQLKIISRMIEII